MPDAFAGELRRALASDVPALAALYADCARTLGPAHYSAEQAAVWAGFGADTEEFRRYVLDARTWVLIGALGEPLGFCGCAADGEVGSLYVRADHSRRGLGRQLLAHTLADAQAQGIARWSAWATPLSRPLFERAGFVWVETVTAPYRGVDFERHRLLRG